MHLSSHHTDLKKGIRTIPLRARCLPEHVEGRHKSSKKTCIRCYTAMQQRNPQNLANLFNMSIRLGELAWIPIACRSSSIHNTLKFHHCDPMPPPHSSVLLMPRENWLQRAKTHELYLSSFHHRSIILSTDARVKACWWARSRLNQCRENFISC